MPVVEEEVQIAQSPEVVFAYLSQPENASVWDSSIVAAEQIGSGPLTTGTRWRGATKIMGRTFDWVTEVTDVSAPSEMTSRSVEGKLTFTVRYVLQPDGAGGTNLTYRVEAESGLGGVFGRLGHPLVQRAQGKTVRGNLARLAEVLRAPSMA
jgi:carbon monoxide dehydrogenase subunit G